MFTLLSVIISLVYLSESMSVCVRLVAGVFNCRLSLGADWFLPDRQRFKGQLLPVPVGSPPLLSKTTSICVIVNKLCLIIKLC